METRFPQSADISTLLSVLLRLRRDGVFKRFTHSAEIDTIAENGQFQRFRNNVARMALIPMAIEHLNVHTLITDRLRCR
jgi:hypothetical protein